MEPTIGRIVHYRLSGQDVIRIAHRRSLIDPVEGGRLYDGNQPVEGDIVPLTIVRCWDNEYSPDRPVGMYGATLDQVTWFNPKSGYGINGQAILDGNDTLWVTSAPHGDQPGSWDWPPRV